MNEQTVAEFYDIAVDSFQMRHLPFCGYSVGFNKSHFLPSTNDYIC